ncbi:MAG: putative heme-binding domain-containing protein [Mariniblastus sp.]|jgi:putative heme-binding domain-containing protein
MNCRTKITGILGRWSLVGWLLVLVCPSANADEFKFEPNDRVVWLGSEFVEQQIKFNFLEAQLTQAFPTHGLQFRNLGWSGDTPTGVARGYFGGAPEGFRRLLDELDRLKPTVVFVCYGANLDDATEAVKFQDSFQKLLGELKKRTVRIVVFSHPAAETTHRTIDATQANLIRQANATTLQRLVAADDSPQLAFVDLFAESQRLLGERANLSGSQLESSLGLNLTHDALRFNRTGYAELANLILASPPLKSALSESSDRVELTPADFEALCELIADKNALFFHRYRPQNETYLRGFRKHEQGQNAKEISEFDALIELAEGRIEALVKGVPIPPPIVEPDPIALTFEAFTPEAEKASFQMSEELEIDLFANEPMVANPIHMNFDGRGRLWVATSPIYPQIKPGAKPRDEIVVLEDSNGDGVADRRTVFADNLLIPTAILPDEQGGAYIANSTEILHLADTDGDGKADQRRVVLSGFGTEDTHHIVHTLRWGPDAAIYFNQSIYIHTHMETPHGVKRLMGSGIWRFDPVTGQARVLMRGLVNPWGHVFDDWGQSFATDGAGGNGINYAFPTAAYQSAVGFSSVLRGMNPGQPKLCGLEIISGTYFPKAWQGTLVTNDFRGNRINRFQLSPENSGYISKQLPDLMSSSHRAFRPVDVKMAPDGSLYIADWYNPIINHGEVDFRDSRRDYKHGRIWRVTPKAGSPVPLPDFKSASIEDLVTLLQASEQWTRFLARVEIKLRIENSESKYQTELKAPLQRLLSSSESRDQLAALWTIQAVGQFDVEALKSALVSEDHRVRAAAVRIIATQDQPIDATRELLAKVPNDSHPQVRLEYVNAWQHAGSTADVSELLKLLDHPTDQYILFATVTALKKTRSQWESNLAGLGLSPEKLMFLIENVPSRNSVAVLFDLLKQESDLEKSKSMIGLFAQRGTQAELSRLFDGARLSELGCQDPQILTAVLNALVDANQKRKINLKVAAEVLKPMFEQPQAIRLAGLWGIEPLKPQLVSIALGESERSVNHRIEATRGLAAMKDIETLSKLAGHDHPLEIRQVAMIELIGVKMPLAAKLTAELFVEIESEKSGGIQRTMTSRRLVDAFLRRANGGAVLAKAFAQADLGPVAKEVIREQAVAANRAGKVLLESMEPAKGVQFPVKFTPEGMAAFIKRVEGKGNPERGESVYRRANLNCMKCHAIGGAGGVVGPDLISLGASSPVDYIVDSLFDPNAKIKEGYHTTSILTVDGIQMSGKLMSQADGKWILRDADNKEHVFEEADIEEHKISTLSLMPVDSIGSLSDAETVDLVAFLAQLGKEGRYKVSNQRYVRNWFDGQGTPFYTKVDGSLPLREVSDASVSFELNVTTAGPIGVLVENPDGLRITLDGLKDNLRAEQIVKDLPVGKHRFSFQFGNQRKRETLRVRLFEVEGSQGHAVLGAVE